MIPSEYNNINVYSARLTQSDLRKVDSFYFPFAVAISKSFIRPFLQGTRIAPWATSDHSFNEYTHRDFLLYIFKIRNCMTS